MESSSNKEFEGEIQSIDPKRLIGDWKDDVENFFLTLSLIYNDLKGLLSLDKLVRETYRMPQPGESSAHAGEFSGLRLQIYRLSIGLVNEFLEFVYQNKKVLNTAEFKLLLKSLPNEVRNRWADIENIAFKKEVPEHIDLFFKTLFFIRNKIAFHYQSDKILRTSFKSFFERKENPYNKEAMFSIGESMVGTRFYYADAAAQEYISSQLKSDSEEFDDWAQSYGEHQKNVYEFIRMMNVVLYYLLIKYIKKRPHQK